MKRALLLSSPLLIAMLFAAGCPFFLEWEDDCGVWGCSDSGDCDGWGSCGDNDVDDCDDDDWTSPPSGSACVPGELRYCDTPTYCSWGQQRCNDQGTGWTECYEGSAPPGCEGWAYDESCCIDSGACCQDWYDHDGDGDYDDSVGDCEEVATCDDHTDCPDGFCVTGEGVSGICHDTGECDEDDDCVAFGPGLACDDRGICSPEEAPCPSGECGCESDAECDDGVMCINSRCTEADSICLFDFECGEAARCLNNECHQECEGGCPSNQECASGVCVDSTDGSDDCVFNEDCDGDALCINGSCFQACDDSSACAEGETCRGGACRADLAPTHSCGDEAGACGDDLVCHRGDCRLPCVADINCTGEMSICNNLGFCIHPDEVEPGCTRATDCDDGESCLSNRCVVLD